MKNAASSCFTGHLSVNVAVLVARFGIRAYATLRTSWLATERAREVVFPVSRAAREVAVVFNNNHGDFALRSATRFGELLDARGADHP